MNMNNYNERLDDLYSIRRFGIKFGLDGIKALLKELGNPHKSLKFVHVAGTNGKGSVCAMLRSVLIDAGYTVGMYTSPHLISFNERFQIGNEYISNDEVVSLIDTVEPIVKKLNKIGVEISFFDFVTAMAFCYFKKKKVDICLVEVGMGGRLDSTNVVSPLVSVITTISSDHIKYLGNTNREIALEKAGIIKKRIPIVTNCSGRALEVIKKKCKEKQSELIITNKTNFKTNLLGDHQKVNLAIAENVIVVLKRQGWKITEQNIKRGFMSVIWPGRLEIIQEKPTVVLDVAHNTAGIRSLRNALQLFEYNKLILIVGISDDKPILEMLSIIVPNCDKIILTKAEYRGTDADVLRGYIKRIDYKKQVFVEPEVSNAVKHGLKIAGKDDLICVTGSIFSVGEARQHLLKTRGKIIGDY